MRQDSYTIQDQTLVIEDCGYAFSLPPGFNILEDDEEDDEKVVEPLKRQASIQMLKNGIDIRWSVVWIFWVRKNY